MAKQNTLKVLFNSDTDTATVYLTDMVELTYGVAVTEDIVLIIDEKTDKVVGFEIIGVAEQKYGFNIVDGLFRILQKVKKPANADWQKVFDNAVAQENIAI